MEFLIIVGIFVGIWLIVKILSAFEKADKYNQLKPKLDNLEQIERKLNADTAIPARHPENSFLSYA